MPPKTKMTAEEVAKDLLRTHKSVFNSTKRETHASKRRRQDNHVEQLIRPFRVITWPSVHHRQKMHPPV